MTLTKLILALVCLISVAPTVQEAQGTQKANVAPRPESKVARLMSRDLPDVPGREGLMLTVEYSPGGSDPVHRHNADAFVYVLQGSIVMQVRGGKRVTLTPGQTFYEGPDDIHVVGRNASDTEPAKFLVFLVKKRGAPILVPAK